MPSAGPSSLPARLQAQWTHRWAPQPLRLLDGQVATAGDWLATVRATTGSEQDVLLRLLLDAAADCEQVAERLLWVLLIPPVDRATPLVTMDGWSRRDRAGLVAAAVWESIRCTATDTSRPHVFRHLVRDAALLLTRGVSADQRRLDEATVLVDPVLLVDIAGAAPVPVVPAEIRLARLFDDAIRARNATADEIALLSRTLLEGRSVAQVATELQVTPATLRRRLQRLTRRLGDHAAHAS
jgi:hypothetical protein